MGDESAAGERIGAAAFELAGAGTRQRKLEMRGLDLLVHDIQQLRNFLDFVDDDPFGFLSQSRQLLGKRLRPQAEGFVLIRRKKINVKACEVLKRCFNRKVFPVPRAPKRKKLLFSGSLMSLLNIL
jgi:hypothetical protein